MMRSLSKKKKHIFFSILFFALGLFITSAAFAQTQITISTSVPGTYGPTAGTGGPGAFVANFYWFALMIGGVLAFGAIVYGGVKYMASAGNPSGQSDAKEWIESALLGLLLLVGAYFILSVINPQLLNLNLPSLTPVNISSIVVPSNPVGSTNGPSGGGGGGGLSSSQALSELNAAGVTVKSGAGGASVAGMQQGTVNDIDALAAQCAQSNGGNSCNVAITSGTDGDHAAGVCSHSNGYKADLRSTNASLNNFITSLPKAGVRSDGAQLYSYDGGTIADERNLPGIGAHWDLSAPCP